MDAIVDSIEEDVADGTAVTGIEEVERSPHVDLMALVATATSTGQQGCYSFVSINDMCNLIFTTVKDSKKSSSINGVFDVM